MEAVRINLPLLNLLEVMMLEDLADICDDVGMIKVTDDDDGRRRLFSIPTSISLTVEDQPLATLLGGMDIRLSLVWKDRDLGIEIAHAGRSTFTRFRSMFAD
jgi:hypothetical protein